MTFEQSCFLQILQDYVHQRPSAVRLEKKSWMKIARYAKEQALEGIIYVQCRDLLPVDSAELKSLHAGFYSAIYVSVNGTAELELIGREFEKAGVSYLPFKGEVVRRYYPEPKLRTMGDIDLLIRSEDQKKTDEIMLANGYDKFIDNHAVWTYFKPNITFEIHNDMFYEYLCKPVDYRKYFDHIWDTAVPVNGSGWYEPEPNRHFLYLICHMAKHIINHGIGLRAYLDIVFMAQREEKLDWDWIAAELDRLQLLEFTKTCFAFCERWFDVTMPLASGDLASSFFEEVTSKTFRDGTFGLSNEQNEAAHSAKEIQRSGKPYWVTALALTWKKLFPPYKDMQLIPWYSFVDGRPWLMPAAWVYRWFYTATHKYRHTKELLIEPIAKRDIINKRKNLINSWKL